MALSIDQMINEVATSGLVAAADLLAWLSSMPEAKRPKSGEELARELVQQQKLTRFQAEQIYAGQGKSLTLGNYLILDKLGQGGMGLVLKAMHRRMERIVALKVMSQAGMKSPDAVQRFQREVKAAAKLHHPNIVTAFDADEANGTHFLVMEYVEGTDLSALVKKNGPLLVEQAVQCVLQAARGLEYAHSQGVIHRDIKPSNLLLVKGQGPRGEGKDNSELPLPLSLQPSALIKILDMGLARIDGGENAQAELTTTGAVMGTVDYMAPEQALSAKYAEARSDIYSLGITLWYLLTGRVAYSGDSIIAKVLAHRDAAIPSLADEIRRLGLHLDLKPSRYGVPTYDILDAVFRKMVAKQAKDRYPSMTEVIRDLERCLSEAAPSATSPLSVPADVVSTRNVLPVVSTPNVAEDRSGLSASETTVDFMAVAISPSRAEAETMILSAVDGSTDPGAEPSPTVNMSGFHRPKTKTILGGTIGTALIVILVIALSMKGSLFSSRSGDTLKNSSGNNHHGTIAGAKWVKVDAAPIAVVRGGGLRFDGQGDSVLLPELTSRDQALTVEGWLTLASDKDMSLVTIPHADGAGLFRLTVLNRGPQAVLVRNQSMAIAYSRGRTLPIGEPFHLAAVLAGNGRWYFWLNGDPLAEGADHYGWFPPVNQAFPAIVGMDAGLPLSAGQSRGVFHGTLRELRISQTARYTTKFQPAQRLEPDKDTIALYHFDEGTGIELRDSSGNGHHGKVFGAQWVKVNDATGGLSAIGEVVSAPSPPWTDWLEPKLNKGDFAAQFDAREWVREGDAISTQGVISGIAVLPQGTRNGAIRLTYLLRDSKGIEIDARDGNTNGVRELYKAQDDGTQLSILRFRKGSPYDYLAKQMVPTSVPKDLPRTLEFRVVGDTLTATLNGSVVATANDATNTVSNGTFALVALKGVLIQKVEYQKLDEMVSKTAAISDRANAVGSPPSRAKAPLTTMQARTHQEVWAKHLGTTVETTNSVDEKMVLIPPGEFLMGSSDEQIEAIIKDAEELRAGQDTIGRIQKDERPQHRVVITKPFFLGATEVTIGQFKKFVAATGFQTHAESNSTDDKRRTYLRPGYSVTDDSPVSCVNWEEAVAYCRWLSDLEKATYRLPTEAEWEYACRAGTKTLWSWGDDRTLIEKYAWTIKDSEVRAHPVATKQPNPFRLFDMHGNLSEWCQDTFGETWYAKSPLEDPFSTSGIHLIVVRGGNWDHHSITRSAYRMALTQNDFRYTVGFRIVREIESSKEQSSPDRRSIQSDGEAK